MFWRSGPLVARRFQSGSARPRARFHHQPHHTPLISDRRLLVCVCSPIPPRSSSLSSSICPAPSSRRLVLSLPKKLLPPLTRLDQRFSRPPYAVSYPVYLLLFFLVGLLLGLIHPAVSAVTMASPASRACARFPPAARSSANWTPVLLKKTFLLTKPRFANTCAALVPEFVAHLCAPLLLMAVGHAAPHIGSALGWGVSGSDCSSCAEIRARQISLLGSTRSCRR